jgi:formate dehydrogenase subunit gamma
LRRFTHAERWVHRATAALMGVCLVTAAVLYFAPLSVFIGRRALIAQVHIIAGIALPVPLLLGWLSRAFRVDVRRISRFHPADWEWLRRSDRRSASLEIGKFNGGQKLFAAFVTGGILVMLGTGLIMRFANRWPLSLRTGATFVHDWLFYGLAVVVIGHLWMAAHDPEARAGMRRGFVSVHWARHHHPAWAADERGGRAPSGERDRAARFLPPSPRVDIGNEGGDPFLGGGTGTADVVAVEDTPGP